MKIDVLSLGCMDHVTGSEHLPAFRLCFASQVPPQKSNIMTEMIWSLFLLLILLAIPSNSSHLNVVLHVNLSGIRAQG